MCFKEFSFAPNSFFLNSFFLNEVKHLSKKYLVQDSYIVIFLRILVCNHFPFENQTCINSKVFDPLLTSASDPEYYIIILQ